MPVNILYLPISGPYNSGLHPPNADPNRSNPGFWEMKNSWIQNTLTWHSPVTLQSLLLFIILHVHDVKVQILLL